MTRPDEYTITISGTGNYIGSVNVTVIAICGHSYDGKICKICGAENLDYVEPTEPIEDMLLGDVDNDGVVNASDASLVLAEYAKIQTGGAGEFTESQHKAADVNNDSVIDSSDASKILTYYAMISTGNETTWD